MALRAWTAFWLSAGEFSLQDASEWLFISGPFWPCTVVFEALLLLFRLQLQGEQSQENVIIFCQKCALESEPL